MQNRPPENRNEGLKRAPAGEEMSEALNNEAMQALDRISRYREELNIKLNGMTNTNSTRYKRFENAYNRLTEIQERLEKAIEKRESLRGAVINATFKQIHEVMKSNFTLRDMRWGMITKQLIEVKTAFGGYPIKVNKLIPLFSILQGGEFISGKGHYVPASMRVKAKENNMDIDIADMKIKKKGDTLNLWIKQQYGYKRYSFKFKITGKNWIVMDSKGKPVEELKAPTGRRNYLEGLDDDAKNQPLVQEKTDVATGPMLKKRGMKSPQKSPQKTAEVVNEPTVSPVSKENEAKMKEQMEIASQNAKSFAKFKKEWPIIDDFIKQFKEKNKSLSAFLKEYGFRPPYTSAETDDRAKNRYRLIIQKNKNSELSLKIENQILGTAGAKYTALEKTGNRPVVVNNPPKNKTANEIWGLRQQNANETINTKEWREAALKTARELHAKVDTGDKIKKFMRELIENEGIRMEGRTMENRNQIWQKYINIAVRFESRLKGAIKSLGKPSASINAMNDSIQYAMEVLPRKSQNQYMAKFKTDVENKIQFARKQPAPETRPQA